MSLINVDKVDPQSGTALEIGTSGDTVTVPSVVGLTLTDSTLLLPTTIKTDKLDPKSGTALEIGSSGDTITIPSGATLSNLGTASGFGKVLQVINAVVNTETINNTDTFADTGLTASITPASTSNKILVIANVAGVGKATNNTYVHLKLLRDSTDLVADFETRGGYTGDTATNKIGSCSVTYLDSPSSTSSLAYKTQLKSGADTAYAQTGDSNGKSSITLMEIAG